MNHFKIYYLIIIFLSHYFCLFAINVNEITDEIKSEKDFKKALKIAEENSIYSNNICAKIKGYPSEIPKLEYFARNSKNTNILKSALSYLSQDPKNKELSRNIADSLVKANINDIDFLFDLSGFINDQDVIVKLYEKKKSSILAKRLHKQDKIIEYLQEEKHPVMIQILLKNLTDESTLERYAKESKDNIVKEIVYWRLNNQDFINDLYSKETNEMLKEILLTRLDIINNLNNDDWFLKLCERQIIKETIPNKSSLSNNELKVKEFLDYLYSDIYRYSKEYISLQDTLRYAIDDRVNETSSLLSMRKLDKNDIVYLHLPTLDLKIKDLKIVYFTKFFQNLLNSLTDNSTYSFPKSEKLFGIINTKKCLEAGKIVISYPNIWLIFNSDMTKVKVDFDSGDEFWTKFYLKIDGKWKPSDIDAGGHGIF